MTEFDELLQKIGNDNTAIEMVTTPARLFILIGQLQLALRHPANSGAGAAFARQMTDNMIDALCNFHPDARTLLERGWDTNNDMSPEQFQALQDNSDLYDDIRITNAANLLQDYAKQVGKPVVLAANSSLHHEDGVQVGNPDAADLEPLEGITVAIPCNRFEAQLLIHGINVLVSEMPSLRGGSL